MSKSSVSILLIISLACVCASPVAAQQPDSSQQPQVKVNMLNVCTPTADEQKEIAAALAKIPKQPLFDADFEVSRGRSTLSEMPAMLESGQLQATDGHYALAGSLSTLAIPATLQDSLMARLDRLVTAKAVAQYAAVIGRQFSYALLQAVSQVDQVMLQHELGRLVEAEIVYQRGLPPQATYTFKLDVQVFLP